MKNYKKVEETEREQVSGEQEKRRKSTTINRYVEMRRWGERE